MSSSTKELDVVMNGHTVDIEAVPPNEDVEVQGYNISDSETDETIGYIFLEGGEGNWVCDLDTDTKFSNDDFDGALLHCLKLWKEKK
jgi:hypothetical protein